jgi:hypothetical protein
MARPEGYRKAVRLMDLADKFSLPVVTFVDTAGAYPGIGRLSPKMRAIVVLRYVESLPYDQISETLGISLGTVKSRLSRAHAALDRELTPVLDHYLLR